ncbi:ATP-binding protein [Sedimenticola sp.]|uniref:ATP-binding protein n=1 Tax=Sedimenticola sp. TaxID=1940285 RepID=UPI003D112FCE
MTKEEFYESQERFQLLAESSLAGMYLIQDGKFKYVNQAFADLFGYQVEEVLNDLQMTELIYPEDRPLVQENIRRRIEGDENAIRYTFRGLRKNKSIIHVEVHGRRVQFNDRAGVIGTLIDITETKRAEEELRCLNDQLESRIKERTHELEASYRELKLAHAKLLQQEKMASIGQLAAGIAHEINTPIQFVNDNVTFLHTSMDELLAGMQMFLNIIQSASEETLLSDIKNNFNAIAEDLELDYLKTEIPQSFETLQEGIKRISRIVIAMKDFSQPSGNILEPVDVGKLIHTAAEVSCHAWKHVADLTIETPDTSVFVNGLKDELGQVVLNLITNAADAIEDTQLGEKAVRGRIQIQARIAEDKWAEIIVKDTGCGMPPEILSKIFDPFFTTKPVGHGSGQGLAIAYHIIKDKHGGELHVESRPNEGSTFVVRLPALP